MITITTVFSKAGVCTAEVYGTEIDSATTKARGFGYSKDSASVAEALNKAGVRLPKRAESYGYNQKTGFKTGGVGMSAILKPFYEAGFCVMARQVSKDAFVYLIFKKSEVRNGYL